MTDKEKQRLRRVRSAATALLRELEGLDIDPAPVPGPQRKRENRKETRVERFERQYAAGTWAKPEHLKKGK